MKVIRDMKKKKLWLSQEKFIEKVLKRFHISQAKFVVTPLANHFKLSYAQCPTREK